MASSVSLASPWRDSLAGGFAAFGREAPVSYGRPEGRCHLNGMFEGLCVIAAIGPYVPMGGGQNARRQ